MRRIRLGANASSGLAGARSTCTYCEPTQGRLTADVRAHNGPREILCESARSGGIATRASEPTKPEAAPPRRAATIDFPQHLSDVPSLLAHWSALESRRSPARRLTVSRAELPPRAVAVQQFVCAVAIWHLSELGKLCACSRSKLY